MHTTCRISIWKVTILVALASLTARNGAAQASAYASVYSFKGGPDGASPNGLTIGKNGSLYGTTETGGANNCGGDETPFLCGTVFELTAVKGAEWTKTILFSFNGSDGAMPSQNELFGPGAKPVFGSNGSLYSVTKNGGSSDPIGLLAGGTVFELAPPAMAGGAWTETVLYNFSGSYNQPHSPFGGVLIGSNGAVYGTTFSSSYIGDGGPEVDGTVFQLVPPAESGGAWTENTLVTLPSVGLGMLPDAGVVSVGGSLYGTTVESDEAGGCGSVYELSPPGTDGGVWTPTAIYTFGGPPGDGCSSVAPLTVGAGGVIYGTTVDGGSALPCTLLPYLHSGCGTVFQLTPPSTVGGSWTETIIYNFAGTNGDGAYPVAGVVLGENGVLYGTTTYGGIATSGSPCSLSGASGCGTVFELTPPTSPGGAWTENVLHSFTGQNGDGSIPGPLAISPGGVLYGPTSGGGSAGKGTIFALEP